MRHCNTILYLAYMVILLGSGCSKDSVKPEFYIGREFGGGIVFDVSADGQHGLIAETIDQGASNWEDAHLLAQNGPHSEAGKAFTDWRLPTKDELVNLYHQKDIVGDFVNFWYWSSTEYGSNLAWEQHFDDGAQTTTTKIAINKVRAVRDF